MYEIDRQGASDVRGIISEDEQTVKRFLEDREFMITDLKALLEAERMYKDREAVRYALNQKITQENVADYLDMDTEDVEGIVDYTDSIEAIIQLKRRAGRTSIPKDQLVGLVLGTVSELRGFVQERDPGVGVLDELLESERDFKDRKTAKRFLIRRIRDHPVGEYLDALDLSYDQLRRCIETCFSTADDEDRFEDDSFDIDGEVTVERLEKRILEKESEQRDRLVTKLVAQGVDRSELEDRTLTELREMLEDARSSQDDDTSKREELIEMLTDRGLPEDDLRQSSTADLEKLLGGTSQQAQGKDHDQIMDEARGDLETITGEDGHVLEQRDELKELLMSYRDRPDEEAAVKTAYLMRGYIVDGLELNSSTTYREVADQLPDVDDAKMERVESFLRDMHHAQYSGDGIDADMATIIDDCVYVIDRLEFSE